MSGVDVVVPAYNYGHFLRECVESVLAQSHPDLRVLIIDDASIDQTQAVCAALAAEDPRVEIRRHAVNQGHIQTYNEGIALAERDYMLLLSADDFLLPGALARAVAVLDARPDVGLAYGDYVTFRAGDRLPDPFVGSPEVDYPEASAFLELQARDNGWGPRQQSFGPPSRSGSATIASTYPMPATSRCGCGSGCTARSPAYAPRRRSIVATRPTCRCASTIWPTSCNASRHSRCIRARSATACPTVRGCNSEYTRSSRQRRCGGPDGRCASVG